MVALNKGPHQPFTIRKHEIHHVSLPIIRARPYLYATGPILFTTLKGAKYIFISNRNICFQGVTFKYTISLTSNLRGLLLTSVKLLCLFWVAFILSLMIFTFSEVICTNYGLINFLSPTSSQQTGVLYLFCHTMPHKVLSLS